jgi:hypothetical protein
VKRRHVAQLYWNWTPLALALWMGSAWGSWVFGHPVNTFQIVVCAVVSLVPHAVWAFDSVVRWRRKAAKRRRKAAS